MKTSNNGLRPKSLAAAISLSTLLAVPAMAQIEEIVVTAQKREQSLQDVPLAISAFDQNFIKESKISDFKDVINFTPGLSGFSKDSFVDAITVRGINTNDFGIGIDPAIGIYVDGVYQGRTGGAVTTIFDVARMEVVKGPQGTLFGRNSTAGAISIYRQKPTDEFGGYVSGGLARFNYRELEAVVNTPISEDFLARTAVRIEREDGYTSNVQGGSKVGGGDVEAGRVSLSYLGFDDVEIDLAFDYENREGTSSQYRAVDTPFGVGGGDTLFDKVGGTRREIDSDVRGADNYDNAEVWGFTGTVEADLNDNYSLTSITAIRGHNYAYQEDFDGSPLLIDTFALDQSAKYYSQELRINFDNGSDVSWFAGLSAYKETIDAKLTNIVDEDLAFEEAEPSGDVVIEDNISEGEYTGYAAYGDVTWKLRDDLELIVGGRYTRDKKEFGLSIPTPRYADGSEAFSTFTFGYVTDGFVRGSDSWSEVTPRIALNYFATEDVTLFASLSTGFKSGGFDTNGLLLPNNFVPYCGLYPAGETEGPGDGEGCPDNVNYDVDVTGIAQLKSVDPETSQNLELGMKSQWFENRLQMNASVYYYQYDDRQVQYASGRVLLLENVGESDGKGVEVDMRFVPSENWDMRFTLAYSDTEIKKIDDGVCSINCVGNQLTGTPEWSGSALISYTVPFAGGEVRTTLEYVAQTKVWANFENTFSTPGWSESNLRVGYSSGDEAWEANLYVENLFDQFHYDGYIDNDAGDFVPNTWVGPAKPRTFGAGVSYNF